MSIKENIKLHNVEISKITTCDLLQLDIVRPPCQRIVDDDKVEEIIKSALKFHKEHNHFNFAVSSAPNLHKLNDKFYLIDGQHRLQALEILYNKYSHNIEFFIAIVEVNTMTELEYNYNMINKNTPLPDFSAFSNIDKNIPEEVSRRIKNKFQGCWARLPRCHRPSLYFNHFQESLAFIVEKVEISSVDELMKLVLDYNDAVSKWNLSKNSRFKATENMIKKAKEFDFYLGLFPHSSTTTFGYVWAKEIVQQQTGTTIKENAKKRKKYVPKKVKNDSWNTYVGETVKRTKCLCCRTTQIDATVFTAGHIISEANGGPPTVENIVPICDQCNLSMGKTNMDEFIKRCYPKNLEKFRKKDYREKEGWFS